MLYPAELNTHLPKNVYYFKTFLYLCQAFFKAFLERVVGIEPTFPAWKAGVLPIYDTRTFEILNLLFNQLNILILLEFLLVKLVGVTGIEPATSWSQTTRAPICATPRYKSGAC